MSWKAIFENPIESGCPPHLPERVGDLVIFTVHGVEFQLKKVGRGDFFLAKNVVNPSRSRWGSAEQIREDLRHVCEMGALPVPGSRW